MGEINIYNCPQCGYTVELKEGKGYFCEFKIGVCESCQNLYSYSTNELSLTPTNKLFDCKFYTVRTFHPLKDTLPFYLDKNNLDFCLECYTEIRLTEWDYKSCPKCSNNMYKKTIGHWK